MADPVELADSLYDSSIEAVGTVSPGATPYQIRVSAALQTQIADHETRIDTLEGMTIGDITAVTAGTGLTGGGASGAVSLAVAYGSSSSTACVGNDSRLSDDRTATGLRSASTVVSVSAATAPTTGQSLVATDSTHATWQTVSGAPTGSAGGDLGGTYPNPTVTVARGLRETSGPTSLTNGSMPDGGLVQRVGSALVASTGPTITGNLTAARFIGPATALRSATTDMTVSAAAAPSAGQVLTATNSTTLAWATPSGAVADPATNFTWSSNAATVDVSLGHNFTATNTMGGNSTLTLSNGVDGDNGVIQVKQDGTGSRTLTFSISGRTVLKDLNVADTNPLVTANSLTEYHYYYSTVASTAYCRLFKVFLQ